MKNQARFIPSLLALVLSGNVAMAVTITIDKNGFADAAGGQISGTGLGSPVPIGTDTNSVSFTAAANGVYNVDFFHNSGPGGSDFFIYIDAAGTGIASNSLSGHGAGAYTMVTGFTPGDTTVTLNSHTITYNANGGQKGVYYLLGLFAPFSIGQNSPPQTKLALPGYIAVDNLYNSGLNAEDYIFTVRSDGTVATYTNNGLHNAEFATFAGNTINPRSARVYYTIRSSTNLCCPGVSSAYPVENFSSIFDAGNDLPYVYKFEMVQAIGNSGGLIFEYGSNTVAAGNAMAPTGFGFTIFDPGPPLVGQTRVNDFLMNGRLRFTNDLAATFGVDGYYFMNTDGFGRSVNALVVGFKDGNTIPLTVAVDAALPEPTSIGLIGSLFAVWFLGRRCRA